MESSELGHVPHVLDGKKMLIVEDDQDMLNAVKTYFESFSTVQTILAGDGNAAIIMAQKHLPDVMILDLMLPKRSGLLVLEKLKANKPRGSKPYIIMITGNPGIRHKQYAETLGADDYLIKPFKLEKLQAAVEEAFRRNEKV